MKSTTLAILLAPLALAVGCATSGTTPEYMPAKVSINDTALDGDLTRLPVVEKFEPMGNLSVTVPLRSNTDFPITIDYRFTFFDANGLPVDASPAWQSISMSPGVVEYLVGTSPTQTAKDFHVDVRPESHQ